MVTLTDALQIARQHHQAGRLDLAAEICRRVVEADPDRREAHYLLGMVRQQQARYQEAIDCFRRVLELMPGDSPAAQQLSQTYYGQAEACCRRGQPEQAVACYRRSIELDPSYAEAHNDLATVLYEQGRLDEAAQGFRRALALRPDYADAHYNLGLICHARGDFTAAIACLQRAIRLMPENPQAEHNLGCAWQALGKLDEALACYERALKLRPDDAKTQNSLGTAWHARGEPAEAIACYRKALRSDPGFVQAHQNLLCALQCREGVSLAELREAHAEFDLRYAAPLRAAWPHHSNDRDPERPLRLGFLSPDFGLHPVGSFLVRALENLDRRQCAAVCYSDRPLRDELTVRLEAAATTWRDVYGVTDERLADQIRADGIDLLFDLAGHTKHNRLLVFARKPAPLQLTWIGYVGTTGLGAMDYLLADRHHVPVGAEPYYCEKVLRLPDGYVCFDPPADAPPVGPLPAADSGRVTFGSFNNPAKISPPVVAAWAQILRRVAGSRLVLKYRGLSSPFIASRLQQLFSAAGVESDRVELLDWSPQAELLAGYRQIDLSLDTFPYSGGLTTCEALWMGVPVITCPGETFASRHSLSHLSTAGLTETIARTQEEYVDLAVNLAHDLPRLAELRARLRPQVADSPLCDGQRLATHLLHLLRDVWQDWCRR